LTLSQQIISFAHTLFDVVGANRLTGSIKLLIVGLESTPKHDLDEFHRIDGSFHISGFEKHATPKLKSMLSFIRKQGFTTELVGRCGYPLKGEVKLKEAAVRAGLGKWGKNTVVLHPEYGNRLRFMAIETDAPLELPADSQSIRCENPACTGCSICIDACPEKVLEPYRMPDTKGCLANVSRMTGKDGSLSPAIYVYGFALPVNRTEGTTHMNPPPVTIDRKIQ